MLESAPVSGSESANESENFDVDAIMSRPRVKRLFAGSAVLALILAATVVGAPPTTETCDISSLPCTYGYSLPTDVTVKLVGVDDPVSLYVRMAKAGTWDSWLLLDEGTNESLGYVFPGANVFTFQIEANADLHFFARDTLNVTIDLVGDDGSVPVNDADFWWQGRMYPEEYQRPGLPVTGYRSVVAPSLEAELELDLYAPDNHTVTDDVFYAAIVGGEIARYGKFNGVAQAAPVPLGASHLKLSADTETWFKAHVASVGPGGVAEAILLLNDIRFGFVENYGNPPVNVDPIAVPPSITEGDVVPVRIAVMNWGEGSADPVAVDLYLDLVGDAGRKIGGTYIALDPKETNVVSISWNTSGAFGNHALRAVVDADYRVDEYDENNVASEWVSVSSPGLADSDSDGLPDRWEWRYGLNANGSSGNNGASGDPDGDGLNNSREYVGATNPTSADTDGDKLFDGATNDLVWLNLTAFANNNPNLVPNLFYVRMYRVRMADGSIFPYSGFRVPADPSEYFGPFGGGTPIPLSLSYIVHDVPLDVYHVSQSDPVATFFVTVDKDQLRPGQPVDQTFGGLASNVTLTVRAEGLFDAVADPDPLLADADGDSLIDSFEIVYENTRYLDYRGKDAEPDGTENLVDADSDNDHATDGRELRWKEYPTYSFDQYDYPLNFSLGGGVRQFPEFVVNGSNLASALRLSITDPYNPDVDGDGLPDGDELNRFRSDPHLWSTDADSASDWSEVNAWALYRNFTIGKKFFDNHSYASIDLSQAPSFWWFPDRSYTVTLGATAKVNASTAPYVATALDVTLWTDGPETLAYTATYDSSGLGSTPENISVTYSIAFDEWPYTDRLEFEARDTAFAEPHRFDLWLHYANVRTLGTDPNDADPDWDGLEDPDEVAYGLGPWVSDTDDDAIWDAAELAYWQDNRHDTFDAALGRAKTFDVDSDKLGDGFEVYLAIDPTNPDPDRDGLTDYGEVFEFVPMHRASLNVSRVNAGSVVHTFQPTSSVTLPGADEYVVKFLAEGSLNRSWTAYKPEELRENYSLAEANDAWLEGKYTITAKLGSAYVSARLLSAASAVTGFVNTSGGINATGKWSFAAQYRLKHGQTYEFNLTLNVSGGVLAVTVKELVALRQGVNPWTDDFDADELKDGDEINITSNPFHSDTDGDGLTDGAEVNGPPKTNPLRVDTDGDGVWDGLDNDGEQNRGTNPTLPDTDVDGLWDGWNMAVEGVVHLGERAFGTNPTVWDTDGDTIPDGWEAERGLNPLYNDAGNDTDQDGLNNSQEYVVDTRPLDNDTDDDGLKDGDEVYTVVFRTNAPKGALNASAYGSTGQWMFLNLSGPERFALASWLDGSIVVSAAAGNQTNPAVYGNIVVWQDDRTMATTGWDIYGYNVSSGTEFVVTSAPGNQTSPAIWGDIVVWQNDSAGNLDISSYNLTSRTYLTLANHSATQRNPSIQGSFVLWEDARYGNASNGWQWDIVGHDLARGFEVRVTEEAYTSPTALPNQTRPDAWSGSALWLDDRYHGSDVVLHSPSNDTFLTNESATHGGPQIADRWVAWESNAAGSWDIYLYDTQTGNATRVTQDPSDQREPFLTDRYLLWTDYRSGGADVWAYDLATGVAFVLANGTASQSKGSAWGDRFVYAVSGGPGLDLRMWNLTRVLSLKQGEPVFRNGDDLWAWRANATGFRFTPSTDPGIVTSYRPAHGFRDKELHHGTDPFHPDTDRDGLIDGVNVATQDTTPLFQNFTALGLRYRVDGANVVFVGEKGEGTDPLVADSDDDALKDGDEVYGYTVKVVLAIGTAFERNVTTDPLDPDVDNDNLRDGVELSYHADPEDADTDDDGLIDGYNTTYPSGGPEKSQIELDGGWVCASGGGDVTFCGELTYGSSPTSNESDGDRISDHDEVFSYIVDLNPSRSDTDGDGAPDGFELYYYNFTWTIDPAKRLHPVNASDADRDADDDGASNIHEYWSQTNATLNDTDLDKLPDGWEIAFGLDPLAGVSPSGNGSGARFRLRADWTHEAYWPGDADLNGTGDPDHDGVSNTAEYVYGKPLDWTLPADGPWWSGLDPLRPDTDADGANDSAEANPKAWWSQAEAYPFESAQVVADSAASKGYALVNRTGSVEILNGTSYDRRLPVGQYRILFRACSLGSSGSTIRIRATSGSTEVLQETDVSIGLSYAWHVTGAFDLAAGNQLRVWFTDTGASTPSVRLDAFVVVALGAAIDVTASGKVELSGSGTATKTFSVPLPDGFVLYAVSANLTLTPEQNGTSWPSNAKLWVGDNSGPLYQWNHTAGSFIQTAYVLDLSGEVNKYLAAHGGGGVSVPLTFGSATRGNISYTLHLHLLPFLSDPTVPDTDGDLLPDGVEAALNGSSFRRDSDNDTLPDAVEAFAGTNLSDSDTDDDIWGLLRGDGDPVELRTLFRTNATDGGNYTLTAVWLSLDPFPEDGTYALVHYRWTGLQVNDSSVYGSPSQYERITFIGLDGNAKNASSPEGFDVWRNKTGEPTRVWMNLTGPTMGVFDKVTPQPASGDEIIEWQPQPAYAVARRETYRNRANFTDDDYDGLSKAKEYTLGTNMNDPDSDQGGGDGLLDGYNITTGTGTNLYAWFDSQSPSIVQVPASDGMVTFLGELSLGTDPTERDTDGDGVIDGNEVDRDGPVTDPWNPDTDGDRLLDGAVDYVTATDEFIPIFLNLWIVRVAGPNQFLGEGVSPANGDPLDADTDDDGMPDGWERRFGFDPKVASDSAGDSDGDGLTNAYEYTLGTLPKNGTYASNGGYVYADNSDADSFSGKDGWEDASGLDPMVSGSQNCELLPNYTRECTAGGSANEGATGDPDADGLANPAEASKGTSATNADSDGDWLLDGADRWVDLTSAEFKAWVEKGIPYKSDAGKARFFGEDHASWSTTPAWHGDPMKPDTDGDGPSDGQEVFGYKVTISWYVGEQLKSLEKIVTGHPQYEYKSLSSSPQWLDTDSDGILDIWEANPRGTSTHPNPPAKVVHFVQVHGSNESLMSSQFNPLIRENLPPVIESFRVDSMTTWATCWAGFIPYPCVTHAWTEVEVRAFDVSPYTLTITVLDNGRARTFSGDGLKTFKAALDVDFWADILLDYIVRVHVIDTTGNEVRYEKKIAGIIGGLVQLLQDIWSTIAGAFAAAVDAIASALSWLLDQILSAISKAVEPAIRPIQQAIDSFVTWLVSGLIQAYNGSGRDPMTGVFSTSAFQYISLFLDIIDIALLIATVVLNIFSFILSLAVSLIMELVFSVAGPSMSSPQGASLTSAEPGDSGSYFDKILGVFGITIGGGKFEGVKGGIVKAKDTFVKVRNGYQKAMGYTKSFARVSALVFVLNFVSRLVAQTLLDMGVAAPIFAFVSILVIIFACITLYYYILHTKPIKWYFQVVKFVLVGWTIANIINYGQAIATGRLIF